MVYKQQQVQEVQSSYKENLFHFENKQLVPTLA